MINKTCPLSDKDKLYVILRDRCEYFIKNLFARDENCDNCPYTKIMSVIRQAYPRLIAEALVDVQPMAGPSGFIFKTKHIYQSEEDE